MSYEDLKDKKVLVTGSSSGIGAATAIIFAEQGCFVGVHYFKTKNGGEQTLQQVKERSDGVLLSADIRDENQVNQTSSTARPSSPQHSITTMTSTPPTSAASSSPHAPPYRT